MLLNKLKILLISIVLLGMWQFSYAYSVLPNGDVTDGELLNPDVVAKQDAFANAPPYAKQLCALPQFKCLRVNIRNLTWEKLFPDPDQRVIEKRLNRTNIPLNYRGWIIEPRSWKNVTYMSLSPFEDHMNTNGRKLILIDLSLYAFAAYNEKGDLVYWGPAASGKAWCDDDDQACQTQEGSFRIYRKKGETCQSGTYPIATHGGSPMPYCMYFYRGFAIHGSTLSGFNNRSRGCIRVFHKDAEWLNQQFASINTKVIVRQ